MAHRTARSTARSTTWIKKLKSKRNICIVIIGVIGLARLIPTRTSIEANENNFPPAICPNTVVNYTCTIPSGTAAGYTDWILPTGTCPTNPFPDKIRLSQYVSSQCSAVVGNGGTPNICGPYRAYSIHSDPIYCLSSILTVNITPAMNGSTVTCYNTDIKNSLITTAVGMATINVVAPPAVPTLMVKPVGPDSLLVTVNSSSSGGHPTSYNVTISNNDSTSINTKSIATVSNGSTMVTFTGLTNGSYYNVSVVAINCAGSSNTTTQQVSCCTVIVQSLPCHTANGDNCPPVLYPITMVNYTCIIPSGTDAGYTDWVLPTGTCPTNPFPDKIRLSQYVSSQCSAVGNRGTPSICGPYRAYSILSDPTYCLSSILTVNITSAMNGSTVTCYNTDIKNSLITTAVSLATINVVAPPSVPTLMIKPVSPGSLLVTVNSSSSGGHPTSYNVTISNSNYINTKSIATVSNGSTMVTFTGLTNGRYYNVSVAAINCAGSSNATTLPVSCCTVIVQSLPCHTASGDNCPPVLCPNTVVNFTCTIPSGTAAGHTDWVLPNGTCPDNSYPDKIRLSQHVSSEHSAQETDTCGPYRVYSIQSSHLQSSILTVNITSAMNGSTVTCYKTNFLNSSITTVFLATIIVSDHDHPEEVTVPGNITVVVLDGIISWIKGRINHVIEVWLKEKMEGVIGMIGGIVGVVVAVVMGVTRVVIRVVIVVIKVVIIVIAVVVAVVVGVVIGAVVIQGVTAFFSHVPSPP